MVLPVVSCLNYPLYPHPSDQGLDFSWLLRSHLSQRAIKDARRRRSRQGAALSINGAEVLLMDSRGFRGHYNTLSTHTHTHEHTRTHTHTHTHSQHTRTHWSRIRTLLGKRTPGNFTVFLWPSNWTVMASLTRTADLEVMRREGWEV